MEVELGGFSSCTLHKDGRVTGGLKYHEGRMAAFAEARRIVSGTDDPETGLQDYAKRWREELERRKGAEQPSPSWVAYATGGAEAAMESVAQLSRAAQ